MKASFSAGIAGLSGKLDGGIYYYHPRLGRYLMRKHPQMPMQKQNSEYRTIAKRLGKLKPSDAYKSNFRSYLSLLRDENSDLKIVSWYSLYVKMMWKMQSHDPDNIDLKTISRAQIETQNLPCRSLKQAIEAGLLLRVNGYEKFTDPI
ncbi:MAG: hypothetical protein PHI68_02130 [Candidatus Cloacimonetes bacterium]|nr:hypothetical protein [Candidatus Cloacimonadota bacterium]